jgi:hypothetical protein
MKAGRNAFLVVGMSGLLILAEIELGSGAIRVDGTEFQGAAQVALNGQPAGANAVVFTMGQPLVASGVQPGAPDQFKIGIGYEYNLGATSALTCHCPRQGDIDGSQSVDAVDLAIVIDVVFFGQTDSKDWTCFTSRSDFDGNEVPDAVDLALVIDHVFFGGAGPVDPCAP